MCEVTFLSTQLEILNHCLDAPWQFALVAVVASVCSFGMHYYYNLKLKYNRMVLRGVSVEKNRVKDVVSYSLSNLLYIICVIIITSNNLYLLLVVFVSKVSSELYCLMTISPDDMTSETLLLLVKMKEIKRLMGI